MSNLSTPLFINHTWHGHSSKSLAKGRPCPSVPLKASDNIAKGVFVVMECTTLWTSMGVNGEGWHSGGSSGGGRGDGEAPWQGQNVETKMTKLVEERGREVNPSPLCFVFFFFFFFFSLHAASLPPPPPCLSVACTGGPLGSSSQPVSWSPPPEQHMIFHDYCYCLCPSSRRLQARCAADVWQEDEEETAQRQTRVGCTGVYQSLLKLTSLSDSEYMIVQ